VIACIHNCPERHLCPQFWQFFRARGVTPAQYAGKEVFMKRVVFDCDRCGKRDVGEPFSVLHLSGNDEGQPLDLPGFHEVVARADVAQCPEQFLRALLLLLKDELGFEHYCEACFKKVATMAAGMAGRAVPASPPARSAPAPLPLSRTSEAQASRGQRPGKR